MSNLLINLSSRFQVKYLHYCGAGARDYWLDVAAAVEADLLWLLQLPAHKFWSQVLVLAEEAQHFVQPHSSCSSSESF